MATDAEGRPVYMLRTTQTTAQIGVPYEFAQQVPEGTKFAFEVTERGFQYVPSTPLPEGMPEWLRELRGGE